jgi:hypothetical protein
MQFHKAQFELRGLGQWDAGTTRYVPMSGGSRSRIPLIFPGYEDIRRYYGGVGMNEGLTESIHNIGDWYRHIGGGILVTPQTAAYVSRLIEQSAKWMHGAVESSE